MTRCFEPAGDGKESRKIPDRRWRVGLVNSRIEEDLVDQLFNSSEKRLARLLLLLANFGKQGNPAGVDISQEILAEMIGATRSRASFFMNKFRKPGFITYDGKIAVHNSLLHAVLREKGQIDGDEKTSKFQGSSRRTRRDADRLKRERRPIPVA